MCVCVCVCVCILQCIIFRTTVLYVNNTFMPTYKMLLFQNNFDIFLIRQKEDDHFVM